MQEYAGSKARGEMAISAACCDELLTTSIAPHQVYGPRDNLFLPNVLEAAGDGKLRIFSHPRTGYGKNKVCFTHVDNYAHALVIGERALYKGSPACANFYVTTDGDTHPHPGYCYFWEEVDRAVIAMGFPSLCGKFMLPYWFMMIIAYICNVIGFVLNMKLKINPFNVRVMVMHRWFVIDAAESDLKFKPIIGFDEGWEDTIAWFKENWLPGFRSSHRGFAPPPPPLTPPILPRKSPFSSDESCSIFFPPF
jgi:nucleoside-diphosphate-sugar epimerase